MGCNFLLGVLSKKCLGYQSPADAIRCEIERVPIERKVAEQQSRVGCDFFS